MRSVYLPERNGMRLFQRTGRIWKFEAHDPSTRSNVFRTHGAPRKSYGCPPVVYAQREVPGCRTRSATIR